MNNLLDLDQIILNRNVKLERFLELQNRIQFVLRMESATEMFRNRPMSSSFSELWDELEKTRSEIKQLADELGIKR